MFKLDLSDHFYYPVRVDLLDEEGAAQPYEFQARFRRLGQHQIEALLAQAESGELTDDELLIQVLTGWREVYDESGNPLPFREDTRALLLDVVPVRPALVRAWIDAVTQGAAKN